MDKKQLTRFYRIEICIVLLITFGMSGLRSIFNLIQSAIQSATRSESLNAQTVTLNAGSIISQLLSATVLFGWGALGLYLLAVFPSSLLNRKTTTVTVLTRGTILRDSILLAALIGIPGLCLYIFAVHYGFSKNVVIAASPLFIMWACANAFAEEVIVVHWLYSRLDALGCSPAWIILSSSLLRGSYHLYQGYSAGLGNIIMGIIFAYYYHRRRQARHNFWPLIGAHALIDLVAFAGYPLLSMFSIG